MSDPPSFLIRLGENDTENQLDLVTSPLEVFNHQVGLFGWNVIAVEEKVRTLLNAEIQSEITSDFLLTRSAILRLLYHPLFIH